jgi:addiction module RelE/StbE family toxin
MKLLWTREALINIADIDAFISDDNPEKAIEFIDYLIKQCDRLIQNPYSGRIVPEISNNDIRELIVKKYRIVYRIQNREIHILTVFESHKMLKLNSEF